MKLHQHQCAKQNLLNFWNGFWETKLFFCLLSIYNSESVCGNQGVPWGNFLSRLDTFSRTYMTSKGRRRYRKPSPEDEGVCVRGTHWCVKMLHTQIHLVSHWFHKKLLPPYSLWTQGWNQVNPSMQQLDTSVCPTYRDTFILRGGFLYLPPFLSVYMREKWSGRLKICLMAPPLASSPITNLWSIAKD